MNLKYMTVPVLDFKYNDDNGKFECYGNTKNIIDHALDRAVDGCYTKSISNHKKNGTMPSMLWSHDPQQLPVGVYSDMGEDSIGLKMKGEVIDTTMGNDIRKLARKKALTKFSIGYREIESSWNNDLKCNDLKELDIREVSWVNFACNEESSLITDMKSLLVVGKLPTIRELEKILRDSCSLSKSEAAMIANCYKPDMKKDIFDLMAEIK